MEREGPIGKIVPCFGGVELEYADRTAAANAGARTFIYEATSTAIFTAADSRQA
jgi:hypothetical protein